jgi:hypothetical protein
MHPADRHPDVANLHVLAVYRAALRLYRHEPKRVAGAALVLLLPPVVLGIGSGTLIDDLQDGPLDGRVVALIVVAVFAAVLTNVGTIVYAGVLDEFVGAVVRGDRRPSIGEAARNLPIWRLIAADLAVTITLAPATALGVLPGYVLLVMLSLVGPIVNIERTRAFRAIWRSFRLTGRHLWLTLLAIGPPLVIELGVHHWLLEVHHGTELAIQLAVSVPLILTVGAFVGLTEVELAYALLARDEGSSVAREVARTAPPVGAERG